MKRFAGIFLTCFFLFAGGMAYAVSENDALFTNVDEAFEMEKTPSEIIAIEKNKSLVVFETTVNKAAIYVNNVFYGFSNLEVSGLTPGFYSVKIAKEGYKEVSFNIIVRNGYKIKFAIEMAKSENPIQLDNFENAAEVYADGKKIDLNESDLGITAETESFFQKAEKNYIKKQSDLSDLSALGYSYGSVPLVSVIEPKSLRFFLGYDFFKVENSGVAAGISSGFVWKIADALELSAGALFNPWRTEKLEGLINGSFRFYNLKENGVCTVGYGGLLRYGFSSMTLCKVPGLDTGAGLGAGGLVDFIWGRVKAAFSSEFIYSAETGKLNFYDCIWKSGAAVGVRPVDGLVINAWTCVDFSIAGRQAYAARGIKIPDGADSGLVDAGVRGVEGGAGLCCNLFSSSINLEINGKIVYIVDSAWNFSLGICLSYLF